ncbi:MAG TPA: hypothetical protein P5569_09060, partial [Candidatus Latescibacteria bacterium]|nr:hypothetical protein [Candidatus Latescibacterota bacterium]
GRWSVPVWCGRRICKQEALPRRLIVNNPIETRDATNLSGNTLPATNSVLRSVLPRNRQRNGRRFATQEPVKEPNHRRRAETKRAVRHSLQRIHRAAADAVVHRGQESNNPVQPRNKRLRRRRIRRDRTRSAGLLRLS